MDLQGRGCSKKKIASSSAKTTHQLFPEERPQSGLSIFEMTSLVKYFSWRENDTRRKIENRKLRFGFRTGRSGFAFPQFFENKHNIVYDAAERRVTRSFLAVGRACRFSNIIIGHCRKFARRAFKLRLFKLTMAILRMLWKKNKIKESSRD